MRNKKKIKRNKRDPMDTLYKRRAKALERVVAAYKKMEATGEDPEDELNTALDALTLANMAVTLEFVSGPHKW